MRHIMVSPRQQSLISDKSHHKTFFITHVNHNDQVEETMQDMDQDGDGRLSLQEYIGDMYR